MSTPGFWEIATLAVIAMLIFGPDKLPTMARSFGKTYGRFKREARSTMDELKRSADLEDLRDARREIAKATAEVERQANLTDALTPEERRRLRRQARPPAVVPPPFDPDAT